MYFRALNYASEGVYRKSAKAYLLQPLGVPKWKKENVGQDFVVEYYGQWVSFIL